MLEPDFQLLIEDQSELFPTDSIVVGQFSTNPIPATRLTDVPWLLEQLLTQGHLRRLRQPDLVPMAGNPLRSDRRTKRSYVLWDSGTPLWHVTVGPDLERLRQNTISISQFAPEYTHPVAFFFRREGVDFLARKFLVGQNLETKLARKEMDPDDAADRVIELLRSFDLRAEESNPVSAAAELAVLENAVLGVQAWSDLDRLFLREVVFAHLRENLGEQPLRCRWTNGDFVARNIMVSNEGRLGIIDYEFARHTHFGRDDWLRFTAFSALPDPVKAKVRAAAEPVTVCDQLFFNLNQAHLIAETLPADLARADIGILADRIRELVTPTVGRHWHLFIPEPKAGTAISRQRVLSVFWANEEHFSAEASESVVLEAGPVQSVRVKCGSVAPLRQVRIDPGDNPGVIHVESITIRSLPDSKVWLHLATDVDFESARVSGTALRLGTPEGLAIVSVGDDPQVILPELPEALSGDFEVEVRLRWDDNHVWIRERLFELQQYRHAGPTGETDLQAALQSARVESRALKDECSRLKQALAGSREELGTERSRRQGLAEENSRLKREAARALEKIGGTMVKMDQMMVDFTETQTETFARQVALLTAQADTAAKNLAEREMVALRTAAHHEATTRLLRDDAERLRANLRHRDEQVVALEAAAAKADAGAKATATTLEKLERELAAQQCEADHLNERIAETEDRIGVLDAQKGTLLKELEQSNSMIRFLRNRYWELESRTWRHRLLRTCRFLPLPLYHSIERWLRPRSAEPSFGADLSKTAPQEPLAP